MKKLARDLLCSVLHRSGIAGRRIDRSPGDVVLCYHRVNDHADPLRPAVPVRAFARHLAWLGTRFRFASAAEIAASPGAGAPRAAVTFDDGHADNLDGALAGLRSAGVPATMFVLTRTRVPWTERVHRIPGVDVEEVKRRLKTLAPAERDAEVAELEARHGQAAVGETLLGPEELGPWTEAGHAVGAHTRTHPILTHCTDEELMEEVDGSRSDLEAALGAAPALFAYPGGAHDERVAARVAAAGFSAAYATGGGRVGADAPRHALPRIDVRPDASVAMLAAEVAGILPALRRRRER